MDECHASLPPADPMAAEPGEYTRLHVPAYPPRALRETAEGRYWRRFHKPRLLQQARVCCFSPHRIALHGS